MPNDTTLAASAGCHASGVAPVKYSNVNSSNLTLANVYHGDHHTLYVPLAAMITGRDTWIAHVSWTGQAQSGDACEIRNALGQVIWRCVAGQANDPDFADVPLGRLAAGGYQVPILDSGRLDITLGRTSRNAYGGSSN